MWVIAILTEGIIIGVMTAWLLRRSGPALRWVLSAVRSGLSQASWPWARSQRSSRRR